MSKTIEIKHRWTSVVLFSCEVDDADPAPMRTAIETAVRAGRDPEKLREERAAIGGRVTALASGDTSEAFDDEGKALVVLLGVVERELASPRSRSNLRGSNLSGSDLSGSNLSGSDLSGSDLRDSDLSDSDLSRSNLRDSNLSRSNLRGSNLSRSNLRDSNLSRSDLSGSDLSGSDLSGSDLSGSNLSGSNLSRSNLRDSNLSGSDLRGSDLSGSDLSRSNLYGVKDPIFSGALNVPGVPGDALAGNRAAADEPAKPWVMPTKIELYGIYQQSAAAYRMEHPEVPVVEHLESRILDAISRDGCSLDMSTWHRCETTHCRAGWAIHLAGKEGYALEQSIGDPALAGRMIYLASVGRCPNFYGRDDFAIEDIELWAAVEQEALATAEAK